MFFQKRKFILAVASLLLILFVFFVSSQKAAYNFRSSVLDVAKIPLIVSNFLSHELRAVVFFHRSYWQALKLKKENDELRLKILSQEWSITENERLKGLLDLKSKVPYETITAMVIGKDFNFFRPYIILNKGRVDGVKKYTPVLTYLGLVGKVLEVGVHSSKVILINDADLSVPALNSRTLEQGLVSGTLDGHCKLRFLDVDSDIKEGDSIVTSGLNMSYPEGVLIGKVKVVGRESSGLGKFAVLDIAVRLSSLYEVLVVKTK